MAERMDADAAQMRADLHLTPPYTTCPTLARNPTLVVECVAGRAPPLLNWLNSAPCRSQKPL